ncbi:MAG: glnA, partial [Pseudonocardiales bacterium]|nr:glnA [Pseudonocardiales bacterium]
MRRPSLSVDELRALVSSDEIDTVIVAITDMQGRLQGKRIDATHFMDDVLLHGTEGCNYLLAVDIEMNTVDGYRISSWERGYGDFVMAPDLASLRHVSWWPGTAMLLADVQWLDDTPVVESPRQILKRQLERLAERGWVA